jgi:hypothetical protein
MMITCDEHALIERHFREHPNERPEGAPDDFPETTNMQFMLEGGQQVMGTVRRLLAEDKFTVVPGMYVVTMVIGDKTGPKGAVELTFAAHRVLAIIKPLTAPEPSRIVPAAGPLPPGITRR